MPPFPETDWGAHATTRQASWGETDDRTTNLVALRDIQPMHDEQAIYDWWD